MSCFKACDAFDVHVVVLDVTHVGVVFSLSLLLHCGVAMLVTDGSVGVVLFDAINDMLEGLVYPIVGEIMVCVCHPFWSHYCHSHHCSHWIQRHHQLVCVVPCSWMALILGCVQTRVHRKIMSCWVVQLVGLSCQGM